MAYVQVARPEGTTLDAFRNVLSDAISSVFGNKVPFSIKPDLHNDRVLCLDVRGRDARTHSAVAANLVQAIH